MPAPEGHSVGAAYFFSYISARGRANLPNFKYRGSDASLLYNGAISPFCNWALAAGHVPRWIHPNVITTGGWLLLLSGHCAIAWYSPTFSEDIPGWALVYASAMLWIYTLLDALDGKQARALGLSSPLGLLCDHGCDSLGATLTSLNVAAALCLGPSPLLYFCWAITVTGFFFNTWEEWFVGSLDLPILNGPNEGTLGVCIMFLWTAAVGPGWWREEALFGLRRNECVLVPFAFAGLSCIVSNVYKTMRAVERNRTAEADDATVTLAQRQAASRRVALTRTVPFLLLIATGAVWCAVSRAGVLRAHPRLLLYALGLLATKCCTGLMVAHLCDDAYRPWCKTLVAAGMLMLHVVIVPILATGTPARAWLDGETLDDETAVYELLGFALLSVGHQTVSLAMEISAICNCRVCTVPRAVWKKGG